MRHPLATPLISPHTTPPPRCSKGLTISSFHGHFYIRSRDLLAIPCVDQDKSFSADIALEESMLTSQVAYIQGALLYTASCGERRIRVMTMQARKWGWGRGRC